MFLNKVCYIIRVGCSDMRDAFLMFRYIAYGYNTTLNIFGGAKMSEKRLNNTIYIMYLVTENYKKAHSLTTEQFMNLDQKYNIINFVGECPDIFDSMNNHEMVEEIDQYVAAY